MGTLDERVGEGVGWAGWWGLVGTLCWAGYGGGCLRAVFNLAVACVVVHVSPVLCLV